MTVMATMEERIAAFDRDGYWIERGLFSSSEVGRISDTFMALHDKGAPGFYEPHPVDRDYNDGFHHTFGKGDPLLTWPRVMHPHKFMPLAKDTLLEPRVFSILDAFMRDEALGSQTMFYYKPPGARGQALHQDNFYLKVEPGTCVAAWTAVDRSDGENGGLKVVPNTHRLAIQCPAVADPASYFAKELVLPPAGQHAVQLELEPGDTLFFNGNVIHGSEPNSTKDRFRRSFIAHYVPAGTTRLSNFQGLIDRRGNPVTREQTTDGGPCGTEYAAVAH